MPSSMPGTGEASSLNCSSSARGEKSRIFASLVSTWHSLCLTGGLLAHNIFKNQAFIVERLIIIVIVVVVTEQIMAVERGAPKQHGQPSRKGKKAWRKNVDITEVEHGIDEVREEIIQGYGLSCSILSDHSTFRRAEANV